MTFILNLRLRMVFAVLFTVAGVVHGRMVYWGTSGGLEFRNSHGAAWKERQRVSLGVFRSGFTPGWANRASWVENWTELAVAVYDSEEKRFAGAVDGSNPLPAGYGGQVYLWAADGLDLSSGPDWLLATHSGWQWPGAGASSALPALVWTTGDDDTVVIGAIQDGGMRMASVDVWPAPEDPSGWFVRKLGRQPDRRAWLEDDDGDGMNNLGEYAAGTDPRDPTSRTSPRLKLETRPDGRWWNLEVDRSPQAATRLKLEASEDLAKWSEPATAPEILIDRADQWKARGRLPESGGRGFFRFRYEIEEGRP